MWSSRRSTEVPVTKEESTAKVRCFEACNTMRADKEKITSLNEQRNKTDFQLHSLEVSEWRTANANFRDGPSFGARSIQAVQRWPYPV